MTRNRNGVDIASRRSNRRWLDEERGAGSDENGDPCVARRRGPETPIE